MKKIVFYECEVCRQRYEDKKWAEKCEAKGNAKEYPIGCIYGNHEKGAFYENITFAVATNKTWRHMNEGASWACRDNGAGDSLGESMCSGNSLSLREHDSKLDRNHPTFKRMVKWLQENNIPVTVWDGMKAVPYKKWMKKQVKK